MPSADGYIGRVLPEISYVEFVECAVRLQLARAPTETVEGALMGVLEALEAVRSGSSSDRKK